jgi:hypothetical protein
MRTNEQVKTYPNPTSGMLTLEAEGFDEGTYQIISINGNIVKSGILNGAKQRLTLTSLPSGIYTLRITKENNIATKQIIIKH